MANRSTPYTLSHKNFTKIHCFMITLKGVLPRDTLSHNFLINCNALSHNLYQKRTPCRIIFTVKGHPVERHIPSSQVWEYPPPPGFDCSAPGVCMVDLCLSDCSRSNIGLGILQLDLGRFFFRLDLCCVLPAGALVVVVWRVGWWAICANFGGT